MEAGTIPGAETPMGSRMQAAPVVAAKAVPIRWWAALGAGWLGFMVYVLGRWVTGPYFKAVPSGPSQPPTWMKVELIAWQVVTIPVLLAVLYRFLVRPYLRERRITTDGLLALVFMSFNFQDPLSSYIGHWFTYNTWMFNRGSWVNDIPGWMSYGKPGAMLAEPILWGPGTYCWMFLLLTFVGCGVMRRASRRWPRLSKPQLAMVVFAFMFLGDVILEGFIFMPLGIYTTGGTSLAIFPEAYHKFGLPEGFFVAAIVTPIVSLRYFTDDRGRTLVERGSERLKGGTGRQGMIRFLALLGICQTVMLFAYNVPVAILIGGHSTRWPADIQNRSYFTDGLCGAQTTRMCPGPGVPLNRGPGTVSITPEGKLFIPPGRELAPAVKFANGTAGPFHGPVF